MAVTLTFELHSIDCQCRNAAVKHVLDRYEVQFLN